MKCSECGRRVRAGAGRPRSTCSKACARARDQRRKRDARAVKKSDAVNKPLLEAERREFRHWALTGEQAKVQPDGKELLELWLHHTCRACRNGRR